MTPRLHAGPPGLRLSSSCITRNGSDQDFMAHIRDAAARHGSVVLRSGGGSDAARASWMFDAPVAIVRWKHGSATIQWHDRVESHAGDPFALIDTLIEWLRAAGGNGRFPRAACIAGYLSYDLRHAVERLSHRAVDDLHLPDAWLMIPSRIVRHDRRTGMIDEVRLAFTDGRGETLAPLDLRDERHDARDPVLRVTGGTFTRSEYEASVERVRQHILDGDIYQANLAQRISLRIEGNPFRLWEVLFERNPAPFYAWIHAGDHRILSTSMERFLHVDGSRIETRPIKGTCPRGATSEEDRLRADALLASPKEAAELSMIVDLERNDLSRVCRPGTVRVDAHRRLESYGNVHHLVSIVTGRLTAPGAAGSILRATFPGGSITGCPKIRAMEIIDELEPVQRHAYTGSIGYIAADGCMDLSIAIRTLTISNGTGYLSLGSGIVFDSSPSAEYEETRVKGLSFLDLAHPGDAADPTGGGG